MAWIPAVIGAVGGIAGGLIGKSGQSSANAQNLRIWREQRDWMTGMSNSEIYRRKLDLERSGFNPMLSFMKGEGASTPSTGMPVMQNENAALAEGVGNAAVRAASAAQVRLIAAQASAQEQLARKTAAEAAITESDVPYSAQSAGLRRDELKTKVENARATFDNIVESTAKTMTEAEVMRQMSPLLQEYQKLLNRGEQLSLAEKKALNDLYESMKGVKGAERLMPLILAILNAGQRR